MRPALAVCVACALATVGLVRTARASGAAFELDYSAPSTCPSEAAFAADVRARIADRGAAATEDGRHFRVRIAEQRGAYRGALETLDPPSVREVSGESCEEVIRALVVFLALAVSPADSPDASTVATPVPQETKAQPALPKSAPVSVKPMPLRPRLGVDVWGIVTAGVASGLAPGGAVAASLIMRTHPSFLWVGHVGGLVAYREESVLDGAFVYLWSAARADAGAALDLGSLRVSAGPVVHAGVLSVRARDLPSADTFSSFWGDVGAFARLDRAFSSKVALSLMLELVAPMQRQSFGIQGVRLPIHEISPVVGILSLGVVLRP